MNTFYCIRIIVAMYKVNTKACRFSRTYVGAGGLKKRIDVALGAKKMIAEGCGLLLIQVPYVDIAISAFIISPSKITVLNDDSKTAPKIKVEGTKVYYTESREGSNQIYTCSFLTKGTFYEQV